MDRFGRPALARQHRGLCLATMGQLDAWGKSERSAMCGEWADGFPLASVRAGDEAARSRPLSRHTVCAREKNAAELLGARLGSANRRFN